MTHPNGQTDPIHRGFAAGGYTVGAEGSPAPAPEASRGGLGRVILIGAVAAFSGGLLIRLFDRATADRDRERDEDDERIDSLEDQLQRRDAELAATVAVLRAQSMPAPAPPPSFPIPAAGADDALWRRLAPKGK